MKFPFTERESVSIAESIYTCQAQGATSEHDEPIIARLYAAYPDAISQVMAQAAHGAYS